MPGKERAVIVQGGGSKVSWRCSQCGFYCVFSFNTGRGPCDVTMLNGFARCAKGDEECNYIHSCSAGSQLSVELELLEQLSSCIPRARTKGAAQRRGAGQGRAGLRTRHGEIATGLERDRRSLTGISGAHLEPTGNRSPLPQVPCSCFPDCTVVGTPLEPRPDQCRLCWFPFPAVFHKVRS